MPKGVYERTFRTWVCWNCGCPFQSVKKSPSLCPECTKKEHRHGQELTHLVPCGACGEDYPVSRQPKNGHPVCPKCRRSTNQRKWRQKRHDSLYLGWRYYRPDL